MTALFTLALALIAAGCCIGIAVGHPLIGLLGACAVVAAIVYYLGGDE